MGRAKKRFYRLHQKLRQENPDEPDTLALYYRAIDIDQREQAALQAKRWREENERREANAGHRPEGA